MYCLPDYVNCLLSKHAYNKSKSYPSFGDPNFKGYFGEVKDAPGFCPILKSYQNTNGIDINELLDTLKGHMCKITRPTIELVARDVMFGLHHGFTIFTFSDGHKIIITSFPERNNLIGAATDNIKIVDVPYIVENKALMGDDWVEGAKFEDKGYEIIDKIELSSDIELEKYMAKARGALENVKVSVRGGMPDYDFCATHSCWGGNSNTMQEVAWTGMGFKIKNPNNINLPGIDGKFYEGPLDKVVKAYLEELSKEQP